MSQPSEASTTPQRLELVERLRATLETAVAKGRPPIGGGLLAVEALIPGDATPPIALATGALAQNDDRPMAPDTPFALASMTKTIVAALVLLLVEEGAFRLDDAVADLTPSHDWLALHIRDASRRAAIGRATLRQLLSHRSGLPDYWEDAAFFGEWARRPGKYWSQNELMDVIGGLPPICAPDRCFAYSDSNYVIVGRVLEMRTGKKLHTLLRDRIFRRLDMRCTWMYFEEPAPSGCGAVSHAYEGELDVTANALQSADWSGGGLYSTSIDQLRFMRALFAKPSLLSDASNAAMRDFRSTGSSPLDAYGLGLRATVVAPGVTLIGHMGVQNAFGFLWEETGTLLVGSLNQMANDAIENLAAPAIEALTSLGVPR